MPAPLIPFKVIKHLPYGLLVQLEDGRRGLIRVRETSWDPQERAHWQERFPLHWQSRAVLLKEDRQFIELSLRLAQEDPWDEVGQRYQRGQRLPGVVTGVMDYGAFVQIAAGITGLLHHSRLPAGVQRPMLDLFWPGDHVWVKILDFDRKKRRLSLGLSAMQPDPTGQMKKPAIPAGQKLNEAETSLIQLPSLEQLLKMDLPQKLVLVVEDNHSQADAMAAWLQRVGQRCKVAYCGAQALSALEQEPPDLALIDLDLPDISGLEIAQRVITSYPEARCVITTGWERVEQNDRQLANLQSAGVGLVLKPLIPEDLAELLLTPQSVAASMPDEAQLISSSGDFEVSGQVSHLPEDLHLAGYNRQATRQTLQDLLEQCCEQLDFKVAFLFSLDPAQRTVEIELRSQAANPNRAALPSLVYSPVRDVAEDHQLVTLEMLTDKELRRFQYLLEFHQMAACLGVQVPANLNRKYALFLLHDTPHRLSSDILVYTQGIALTMATLLEKQAFQEQLTLIQRTALLGHLTSTVIHDVNNQIGSLPFEIEVIKDLLREDRHPSQGASSSSTQTEQALTKLDDMRKSLAVAKDIINRFLKLLTRSQSEMLRVDEMVAGVVEMLDYLSRKAGVHLTWVPTGKLLIIYSQSSALTQVFVNVLLNAIQQVQEHGVQTNRWVQVRIEAPEGERPTRVLVEDNGPGIHFRQWDRIFEVGYTTRKGGSGMGLFIARNILDALDGKIYVEESYIMGGTVFAIELPGQI